MTRYTGLHSNENGDKRQYPVARKKRNRYNACMKTDSKALIFYFSGTGCTELLVKKMTAILDTKGLSCTYINLVEILKGKSMPDITQYALIGISHPVHSFKTPALVYKFEKLLPHANSKPLFFLKAAGEEAHINDGASFSIGRRLQKKGYRIIADRTIAMPSNWLWGYSEKVSRSLISDAQNKLIELAEIVITSLERSDFNFEKNVPLSNRLISFIGKAEHFGAHLFGKDLKVSSECNNCKLCIINCPVSNMYEKKGKIRFKFKCLMCMKCVYDCPQKAIHGRLLNAVILKDGFDIKSVSNLC